MKEIRNIRAIDDDATAVDIIYQEAKGFWRLAAHNYLEKAPKIY